MSDPEPGDIPVRAIDRVLAFTALGLAAASIVSFFAILAGMALGVHGTAFGEGAWPVVAAVPWIGLPLAFLLMILLLVMSFVRRARANRSA